MLERRLEDLDYRIAQYRRDCQQEDRLRRRREALLASHEATHEIVERMNEVLRAEEAKLERGMGLFHRGIERRMVEDLVAVENLAVFKAACQYDTLVARLKDVEAEVMETNSILEHRKDHHEQQAMLEEWRNDLYERVARDVRDRNALLHDRLNVWLQVADREDDLDDLEEASASLEETLMALEASIAAGTRVKQVQKRDLAVLANLQPPRSKQFLLLEMSRKAKEAFRHASILIDVLQGIEHLQVHVRDPMRILDGMAEALLLDHYEGERPWHSLRDVHDHHRYFTQIRGVLRQRKEDVRREIAALKAREDELLLMAVDRRLKQRSTLNRW